ASTGLSLTVVGKVMLTLLFMAAAGLVAGAFLQYSSSTKYSFVFTDMPEFGYFLLFKGILLAVLLSVLLLAHMRKQKLFSEDILRAQFPWLVKFTFAAVDT